jgi:hypothetical protein
VLDAVHYRLYAVRSYTTLHEFYANTIVFLKMNPRIRNMQKTPQIKILIYKIWISFVYIVRLYNNTKRRDNHTVNATGPGLKSLPAFWMRFFVIFLSNSTQMSQVNLKVTGPTFHRSNPGVGEGRVLPRSSRPGLGLIQPPI